MAPGVWTAAEQMRASRVVGSPHNETPEMRRTVLLVVRRAKAGDRDALRFLYVRYAGNVSGYVRSIVRDHHEAEDITQLVFAKLITVIDRYDEGAVPFFGWLLRVAHNAAIDYLRSNRTIAVAEVHGTDDAGADDDTDRRESFAVALATLPEEQRSVVLLRHVVGLSPGEIAELLGRSESSVHGLHYRGRRALQCELTRLHARPCTLATATTHVVT
ncbi:MAG: polymerase, sigma-24 subunit, subfamily [Frankiales bacterium]|nr:polymerase, sigma-24 subunit, subfamily [Frankiales bacterium]MCW3017582.1 polymerase, sigma-24 subunit, subfamily [Solirubrobacterales bacterium]